MPPTTGGSTRGTITSERSRSIPGKRHRASTSAIGTPSTRHATVLAADVCRLSTSAARADSLVIRDQ